MMRHNTDEYVIFLKFLKRLRLNAVCCCCRQIVAQQLEELLSPPLPPNNSGKVTKGVDQTKTNPNISVDLVYSIPTPAKSDDTASPVTPHSEEIQKREV